MSTPEPRKFINEDLSGQDLSGQSFVDCHFEDTNLSGANLSGCDFTGAHFDEVDLSGADLSECTFDNCYFEGINLSGVSLSGCDFTGASFMYVDLSGADLSECTFDNCYFEETNLSGANLSRCDFKNINLCDANLSKCDFTGTSFMNVDLRDLDLGQVNLENTSWTKINIYDEHTKWPTDFDPDQHPNLQKIGPNMNLRGFDFTNIGIGLLRYQNFSGANLSQANFSSIDLEEASFQRANLIGTNFSGTQLSQNPWCFNQAVYNRHTVWPDNFPESSKEHMIFVTSGAQLPDVDLTATVLKDLDLSNIDLSNANLSHVTFEKVDLSGACLIDANITNTTFKNVTVTQTTILPRSMTFDNLADGLILQGPVPISRGVDGVIVPNHISNIIAKLSDEDQSTLTQFMTELASKSHRYLVMMQSSDFDYKFRSDSSVQNMTLCKDEFDRDMTKAKLLLRVIKNFCLDDNILPLLFAQYERLQLLYKQGTELTLIADELENLRSKLVATYSSHKSTGWTIIRGGLPGDLERSEYKAIHIDLDKLRANQQS